MARISRDDVLHVARLARLSLTEEEVETFTTQFEGILEHVARMDALDTSGVATTAHPIDAGNVWREDECGPCLPHADVLANAPEARDGLFVVPPP